MIVIVLDFAILICVNRRILHLHNNMYIYVLIHIRKQVHVWQL